MVFYVSIFLCAVGGLQGLFLTLVIVKFSKKKSGDFRWLIALLSIVSITLIGRTLFLFEDSIDLRLTILTDLILFLYGPLFYFFVLSSFKTKMAASKFGIHLLPALIHLLSVIPQFTFSLEEYLSFTTTASWQLYINTVVILALAHNLFYCLKSYQFFKKQEQFFNSHSIPFEAGHYKLSNQIYAGILVLFFIAVVSFNTNYIFAINMYQITWISISWFTYGITYYLVLHPNKFGDHLIKARRNHERHIKDQEQLKKIAEELKHELDSGIYLDSELSLATLSQKLKTNNVVLSKAINKEFRSNFYDLINHYRIEQFINLAGDEAHAHLNYLGLATEVGFNSKTTFNKYFKKYKGVTPKEYFKRAGIS